MAKRKNLCKQQQHKKKTFE